MEATDSRYTVRPEALSRRMGRRLPIAEQIAGSIRARDAQSARRVAREKLRMFAEQNLGWCQ
jgi:hypothetical protein